MTHSLTGNNHFNLTNLKGTNMSQIQSVPTKIKRLKERVIKDYLIPIFTKQWNIINENTCFIETIQKNINYYYDTYKLDELTIYVELLKIIRLLIDNQEILDNYENRFTNHDTNINANEVVSILFKTTKIRLRPEYEIYDSIIGKPKKGLNQTYNNDIIFVIQKQLEKENMTYQKIKEIIEKIMPLHSEN